MRLQLIFGIHRATHRIGLFIQKHEPDLTQAEAHILCHLHEAGDTSIADLHRAFAHKRSTLTSLLDRLDARGLVKRETSSKDRRSFVIRLTRAGKKKAAAIHQLLESLEAGVVRRGDRQALETFDRLIRELEQTAAGD
jgi:DNA-binding MarR family transcriptional regulator